MDFFSGQEHKVKQHYSHKTVRWIVLVTGFPTPLLAEHLYLPASNLPVTTSSNIYMDTILILAYSIICIPCF